MDIAHKVTVPEWVVTPELQNLFEVLGSEACLLVGGCVRNAVMSAPKTDIDIATVLTPEQVIEKCEAAGIKTLPIGIDHGTVMAVIDDEQFEITTLRCDVETDGRHAKVEFSESWLEDAKRRDFTMNALYMDLGGNVYDPLGMGIDDAKAYAVKFVGEPRKRIEEDYLRILRFFRFQAQYGQGVMEAAGLAACRAAADKIETLSRERVTQEFLKIIATHKAADILSVMFDNDVLKDFPHENYKTEILSRLIESQKEYVALNILSRLFVLGGNKPGLFEKYLRLSHDQKKFLIKLEMATDKKLYSDKKALKKAIFYHGNDLLLQGYLLILSIEKKQADAGLLEILKNWQAPDCPVTGEALLAEGFQTGPELGQELKRRIEEWLETI